MELTREKQCDSARVKPLKPASLVVVCNTFKSNSMRTPYSFLHLISLGLKLNVFHRKIRTALAPILAIRNKIKIQRVLRFKTAKLFVFEKDCGILSANRGGYNDLQTFICR